MALETNNRNMHESKILQYLHSNDPSLRIQAVITLKNTGVGKAAELLIPALDDEDFEFRQIITATLLELGKPIIPNLIKHIKISNQIIRESVVGILSEICNSSYSLQVLNLLSDNDPLVRASAIEILGRVKDVWAISHTREFLKDPEPVVRTKAAQALGNMNDSLSVDSLLELLTDNSPEVKLAVIESLAKLSEPRSCDSLWEVSNNDKDPQIRNAALHTLKQIGNTIVKPYYDIFLSADVNVRTVMEQKLSELGRCVILPLIEYTKHYSASAREIAVTILGNIGDDVATKRLIQLINDSDPKVRIASITALGKIHSPATLQFLISCLKDLDPVIVSTATNALVERGEEIVKYLPKILSEQDMTSQITVTRLIGKIQNPDLVNMLAEYLSDPRMWIRRAICFALGETKNPIAANLLTEKCLFDRDTLVRAAAAQALGKLKMPYVLDTLLSALDDNEESVKIAVIKAIGELQITGSGSHLLKFLSHESFILKIATIQTLTQLHYIGAIPLLKIMARSWPFGKESEEVRAEAKQALKLLQEVSSYCRP